MRRLHHFAFCFSLLAINLSAFGAPPHGTNRWGRTSAEDFFSMFGVHVVHAAIPGLTQKWLGWKANLGVSIGYIAWNAYTQYDLSKLGYSDGSDIIIQFGMGSFLLGSIGAFAFSKFGKNEVVGALVFNAPLVTLYF